MSSRAIHFYRILPGSGQRVRYRMELDARNNVISEVIVGEPKTRSELPAEALRVSSGDDESSGLQSVRSAHLAQLAARGMKFTVAPDGHIDLLSVPPLEQAIHQFYIEAVPCWFEGCAQLRQEWQEFLLINNGLDPNCPDCVRGQLMEQFRDRIEPLITLHLNGQSTRKVS